MHFPEMLLMECEGCKKGKNQKQFRKGRKRCSTYGNGNKWVDEMTRSCEPCQLFQLGGEEGGQKKCQVDISLVPFSGPFLQIWSRRNNSICFSLRNVLKAKKGRNQYERDHPRSNVSCIKYQLLEGLQYSSVHIL